MTDNELVEKVAREVMGWEPTPNHWWIINPKDNFSQHRYRTFYPLTDANDLMMVLGKFDRWVIRNWGCHFEVAIFNKLILEGAENENMNHAVLEAAIKAVEGK